MKRIQVDITDSEHKQLKLRSVETGVAMTDMIRVALKLQEDEQDAPKHRVLTMEAAISKIRQELDSALEHCQDYDARRKLELAAQEEIDALSVQYE